MEPVVGKCRAGNQLQKDLHVFISGYKAGNAKAQVIIAWSTLPAPHTHTPHYLQHYNPYIHPFNCNVALTCNHLQANTHTLCLSSTQTNKTVSKGRAQWEHNLQQRFPPSHAEQGGKTLLETLTYQPSVSKSSIKMHVTMCKPIWT